MNSYPGISTSAPTLVTNATKGIGFMVSVAPNPAAYRGLTVEVSLSYDGVTFGAFQSVKVGQDTSEAFQGRTSSAFFDTNGAAKVNYVIVNADIQTLTATVSATPL